LINRLGYLGEAFGFIDGGLQRAIRRSDPAITPPPDFYSPLPAIFGIAVLMAKTFASFAIP
jgi:hypothetical protein